MLAVRLWSRESGSIPQVALPHADGRAPRFVVAHEWKVKESVGADVLGGPQPRSNEIALWGGGGRPWFSIVRGRGRRPRRPGLRAAEDVRPYRRHRGSLGQRHRVFHSKKLRCTFAQMLRCQRHLRECPKLKCKSRNSSPEQTFAFQSRQRFCRAARFSVSPEGMEMAISRRPCPFSCFLV